jgi:RNA polymerase subunit RPABC4/transcription elongation factor Spt4
MRRPTAPCSSSTDRRARIPEQRRPRGCTARLLGAAWRAGIGAGWAAAALTVCAAAAVRADGPYEGTWRAGPTRIDVVVESWGPDCGPRPQSVTGRGGGTVQVEQQGDHLVFRAQRVTRTDGCWSENRAIRKVSSTAQAGSWRTVCRTAPGDSRGETGTYTVRASGGDTLELRDVSEYDWSLNQSTCKATSTSTQTLTRVRETAAPPPLPPPPEEGPRGCSPGAPTKLVLRPARVEIEPGERTCLRARVTDAAGCAVAGATIAWALERPATRHGELSEGCFQAATGPAAVGDFGVVATSGALRDRAVVSVKTRDLSDLIARRGEAGMLAAPAGGATATSEDAAGLRASAAGSERGSLLWPLVGAGTALLLLALGVLVLVAGRRKPAGSSGSAASAPDGTEDIPSGLPAEAVARKAGAGQGLARTSGSATGGPAMGGQGAGLGAAAIVATARPPAVPPKTCPVCHREVPGDTAFCPHDGSPLAAAPVTAPIAPSQAKVCPTCRRGYPPDARFCPADSDELVPYALWAAQGREASTGDKPKICPKCGTRYAASTAFCGKDGATLQTVN